MDKNVTIPILIPIQPDEFWSQIRNIMREEVSRAEKTQSALVIPTMETPGLTEKPLFKIQEICALFKVTKPTIYDWIKHGKLKKIKIRSRVYFLGSDVRQLMQA